MKPGRESNRVLTGRRRTLCRAGQENREGLVKSHRSTLQECGRVFSRLARKAHVASINSRRNSRPPYQRPFYRQNR